MARIEGAAVGRSTVRTYPCWRDCLSPFCLITAPSARGCRRRADGDPGIDGRDGPDSAGSTAGLAHHAYRPGAAGTRARTSPAPIGSVSRSAMTASAPADGVVIAAVWRRGPTAMAVVRQQEGIMTTSTTEHVPVRSDTTTSRNNIGRTPRARVIRVHDRCEIWSRPNNASGARRCAAPGRVFQGRGQCRRTRPLPGRVTSPTNRRILP